MYNKTTISLSFVDFLIDKFSFFCRLITVNEFGKKLILNKILHLSRYVKHVSSTAFICKYTNTKFTLVLILLLICQYT